SPTPWSGGTPRTPPARSNCRSGGTCRSSGSTAPWWARSPAWRPTPSGSCCSEIRARIVGGRGHYVATETQGGTDVRARDQVRLRRARLSRSVRAGAVLFRAARLVHRRGGRAGGRLGDGGATGRRRRDLLPAGSGVPAAHVALQRAPADAASGLRRAQHRRPS